jgi:UDP-glucose 4-epimerase
VKLAKRLPVFPQVNNHRSMLYIENLCEFLCQLMLVQKIPADAVVLLPQNREWTNTSDMVRLIAKAHGKRIHCTTHLAPMVLLGSRLPGKIGGMVNKAFGNNCYEHALSEYAGISYQGISLKESIYGAEKGTEKTEGIDAGIGSVHD